MRAWQIWGLVAFVVVLAAAMFMYFRTLPAVTEDEMREAIEEVEHIRASLDDIECQRPAITWDRGTNTAYFMVERNDENLYELVTPGFEHRTFSFRCPLNDARDTPAIEEL